MSELANGSLGHASGWRPRPRGGFAFDTEFMGEGRYRTLLCLIQLAVPERIPPTPSGSS